MSSKMGFKTILNLVLIFAYLSSGPFVWGWTLNGVSSRQPTTEPTPSLELTPPPWNPMTFQFSTFPYKLSRDYEKLLENGNFSDVRLIVGTEKREFRLHKNILYARCPVIVKMFNAENQVILQEESPEVFEKFIKFVYAGTLEGVNQYARELLILSDKYQMDCLKHHCTLELSNLTTQSVTSTLVFADLYNAAELKSKCIRFITQNMEEVMGSEDWKQLKDRADLLLELLEKHVAHSDAQIKAKAQECVRRYG